MKTIQMTKLNYIKLPIEMSLLKVHSRFLSSFPPCLNGDYMDIVNSVNSVNIKDDFCYDKNDELINNNLDRLSYISKSDWKASSAYKGYKVYNEVMGAHGYHILNNPVITYTPTQFEDYKSEILNELKKVLDSIDGDRIVKCLIIGVKDDGGVLTCGDGFFLSRFTSVNFLYNMFHQHAINCIRKYSDVTFTCWQFGIKNWISRNEYKDNFDKLIGVIEKVNAKKINRGKTSADMSGSWGKGIGKGKMIYDIVMGGNYGLLVKTIGSTDIFEFDHEIKLEVTRLDDNKCKVVGIKNNEQVSSWIDCIYEGKGVIVRKILNSDLVYVYNLDNVLISHNVRYSVDSLREEVKDIEYDSNIGTLDIETYRSMDEGSEGLGIPYACGFLNKKGVVKSYYKGDNEDSIDMIVRMLNELVVRENDKTIFYVHNLAGFDSRYILSAISRNEKYKYRIMGKEMNEIFSIKLTTVVNGKHITVLLRDSLYLLDAALRALGDSFGVDTRKGVFPYDFMSAETLNYIGGIPDFKYYKNDLARDSYLELCGKYDNLNLWCAKNETLAYLESDLRCLHQVMNKFSMIIFERFNINVTKSYSISSLSLKIFLSNYYNSAKVKIPIIQGYVEKEIRKAFFGGVVDVVENIVTNASKYDKNSHYAAAMKNAMPVGNPIFSDLKDLNQIFGFCYAKIVAPSKDVLRVTILPVRTEDGDIICPRGEFEGWYFSEELKCAVRLGYKVDVINSFIFSKGYNIFDNFVDDMFEFKAKAIEEGNKEQALIYKLIKNSLFGKTGQREIINSFRLVTRTELEEVKLKYKTDLTQKIGGNYLIRTQGKLEPEILALLKNESQDSDQVSNLPLPSRKSRGVKSSVSIAAAISSYARISMNYFKNIPDNPYLGGDTDSAILQHPLDERFVGKGLGMMKYEGHIVKGIFADKKLYYYEDEKGKEVIKSRGIGRNWDKSDILNYGDFLDICAGKVVTKDKWMFHIKNDAVWINKRKIKVSLKADMLKQIQKAISSIVCMDDRPENADKYSIVMDILSRSPNKGFILVDYKEFILVDYKEFILIDYVEPIKKINLIRRYMFKFNPKGLTLYHSNLSIMLYNVPNLPTIVYKNPNLSLIVYKAPELRVIVYKNPNLNLIIYKPRDLGVIIYKKPNLSIIAYTWFILVDYKEFILIDYKEPINLNNIITSYVQIKDELNKVQISLVEVSNKLYNNPLSLIVRKNYDIVEYGVNYIRPLWGSQATVWGSIWRLRNSVNNNLIIRQMHMESKKKLERGIKHKNQLDILARLLTSCQYSNLNKGDVCVAVCQHENKLYIASNKNKPEYAKECLEDLQELIKNHSLRLKSYEKLLKKAVEKIGHIKLKGRSSCVIIKEFKEKARECSESKKPDWTNLQALAKKLFHSLRDEIKETSKENSIINQMWKFLMPWVEVGEVVRLIIENEIDDLLKNSIEQCENKVVYVECENEEGIDPNKGIPVHAEMKIVNKLYIKRKKKQLQEIRYIGCTKKACTHCQAIIDVFNEDGKYSWENYGTHGGTYINCKYPNIVTKYDKEQGVKSRIEQIKSRGLVAGNSTTSEIPETLTNPVQLLDKLRVVKRNNNSGEMGDVENQNNLKYKDTNVIVYKNNLHLIVYKNNFNLIRWVSSCAYHTSFSSEGKELRYKQYYSKVKKSGNISRGIRQYYTSYMGGEKDIVRDIKKGNTIRNVGQSNVLKPILKSKLLAPLSFNNCIIENINNCEYILSRIPDNNLVKQMLISETENNKIKVIALKGLNSELHKVVLETDYLKGKEDYAEIQYCDNDRSLGIGEDFTRNKFSYTNIPILRFNPEYTLIKDNKKSLNNIVNLKPWDTCCYIITFNNNLYYYIGSTIDIKNRTYTHFNYINNVIKYFTTSGREGRIKTLPKLQGMGVKEHFIESEIKALRANNINIKFSMNIVYLATSYLNKFKNIYPEYKLSKGEWILLYYMTDLTIRILEHSLIIYYRPKLNFSYTPSIKYFDWDDRYLQIYSNSGDKLSKEYLTMDKYVLVLPNNTIHGIYTLHALNRRHRLDKNEVKENLNRRHHYKGATLSQPLLIYRT